MFELKNVNKFYNNNGVVTLGLRNINLKLNVNEIVAITGDSGSGKSTLLNVITGVDTYDEGEILFYGNETSYFDQNDMDAYRKNNVSFIFQKYNIIESYTVLENVMTPLLLANYSNQEAKAKALEIIKRVGLEKRIKHKGSKLSGGEKQRCVIARALASDAKVLACDEPTGNLDSETGKEIIKLIKEVSKDKLVLIVTHNFEQVKDIVTRKIKISDGEIVEDVIFTPQPNEENKPMDLSVDKINKKHQLSLAFKNIKSTPKKSSLVALMFFVVSIIALCLSLTIYYAADMGMSGNQYTVIDDSRLVVYNKDHSPLNKDEINQLNFDETYYNSFYEDGRVTYNIEGYSDFFKASLSNHKVKDIKTIAGSFDDNGINIIVPDSYLAESLKDGINRQLFYGYNHNFNIVNSIGKISSISTSKSINIGLIYTKQNLSDLKTYYANNLAQVEVVYNNQTFKAIKREEARPKSKIILPLFMKDQAEIKMSINDLYPVINKVEVIYDNILEPTFIVGQDSLLGISFYESEIFEASIYNDNLVYAKDKLNRLNYSYSIPAKLNDSSLISIVIAPFYIIHLLIVLILLYFVSYAILSKVYISKSKDYSILRTLGVQKKQLGNIVILETMFLGISSSLLALIALLIIGYATHWSLIFYLTLLPSLIFIILISLFSYLLGRRFNKKLFKFSISETLKEGDQ